MQRHLAPFNNLPSHPRSSASSLVTSEASSYVTKSPGGLVDDPIDWNRTNTAEYFLIPSTHLPYIATAFGASPPKQLTFFRVPVDPPRFSEQASSRLTSVWPFTFEQENLPVPPPSPAPPLAPTNPPSDKAHL